MNNPEIFQPGLMAAVPLITGLVIVLCAAYYGVLYVSIWLRLERITAWADRQADRVGVVGLVALVCAMYLTIAYSLIPFVPK